MKFTRKELLAELNTYREKLGMPVLTVWKKSGEALEIAVTDLHAKVMAIDPTITRLPTAVAEGAYENDRVARDKTGHSTRRAVAPVADEPVAPVADEPVTDKPKQTKARKAVKPPKATKQPEPVKPASASKSTRSTSAGGGDTVSLADIARDAGVLPERARAKFRRLYADGGKGLPKVVGEGWDYKRTDVDAVKKMLSRDYRANA